MSISSTGSKVYKCSILLLHTAKLFSNQQHDPPWLTVYQNTQGSHLIHLCHRARAMGVRMLALIRGIWADLVIQNLEWAVVIFSISCPPLVALWEGRWEQQFAPCIQVTNKLDDSIQTPTVSRCGCKQDTAGGNLCFHSGVGRDDLPSKLKRESDLCATKLTVCDIGRGEGNLPSVNFSWFCTGTDLISHLSRKSLTWFQLNPLLLKDYLPPTILLLCSPYTFSLVFRHIYDGVSPNLKMEELGITSHFLSPMTLVQVWGPILAFWDTAQTHVVWNFREYPLTLFHQILMTILWGGTGQENELHTNTLAFAI